MNKKEKVLVLFSGGKDSLLSTCRLVENGYEVHLVTYDNGCVLAIENTLNVVSRLINRFGEDNIKYAGTHSIRGLWRHFFLPVFNMKPNEIVENYGQLPISQLNCLMCRSSMYIYSIVLCKLLEIKKLAEGARRSQQFAIELEEMTDLYKTLLKNYNIDLLLPVIDEKDDFSIQNELLMSGLVPNAMEPQCLLGCPIDKSRPIDQEIINAVTSFYNKEIATAIPYLLSEIEKPIAYTLKRKDWNKHY